MDTPPFVVLAAVDLGDATEDVLARALEMAAAPSSVLHVLHVQEQVAATTWDGMTPFLAPPLDPSAALALLQKETSRAITTARALHPGSGPARAEVHVTSGSPAREIVWLAAHLDADALVIGTHGRRGLRRLLLGSVAERVVRLAGCPVVVAREKRHAAPWKMAETAPMCPECSAVRSASGGARLLCPRHQQAYRQAHVD